MPSEDDALYAQLFGGSMPGYSLPSGPDEPPPPPDAPDETALAWAERTGRITAASRPIWENNLTLDPERTNACLRILYRPVIDGPSTTPRPATARPRVVAAADAPPATYAPATGTARHGTARMQTASGIDVSPLPGPLQRAAARVADREKVVTWLQRYTGAPEPEGGWIGELVNQGDTDLAVAIEADEADAALVERARLMADSEKAQAAWRLSPDNPEVTADMEARRRRENEKLAAAEAIDRQSRRN